MYVSKDEFVDRINKKFNRNIELVSPYVKATTKVELKCKNCGNVFSKMPYSLYSKGGNNGCPFCNQSRTKKYTHNEIQNKIREATDNNIIMIGTFTSVTSPTEFKCKKCGNIFSCAPRKFYHSKKFNGCPKCIRNEALKKRHISEEEISNRLSLSNPELILKKWTPTNKKLYLKCTICGTHFTRNKSTHYNCPECTRCESSGELTIRNILEFNNIEFQKEYPFYNKERDSTQRIDFMLNTKNIAIEVQGIQHFYTENDKNRMLYAEDMAERDAYKLSWCKSNNIILIYIDYESDMYNQLKDELIKYGLNIKRPNKNYLDTRDTQFNFIVDRARLLDGLKLAARNTGYSQSKITTIVKEHGYHNYNDLISKIYNIKGLLNPKCNKDGKLHIIEVYCGNKMLGRYFTTIAIASSFNINRKYVSKFLDKHTIGMLQFKSLVPETKSNAVEA